MDERIGHPGLQHIAFDQAAITAWNESFQNANPEEIVAWALRQFEGRVALSCSFGGDGGTVLAHLVSGHKPPVPVLFLDTELLFAETYDFRVRLARDLNLHVIDVKPPMTVAAQNALVSRNLWDTDPDRCCHLRKVRPMQQALKPYDAWITGIRQNQTVTRSEASMVAYDPLYNVIKICPLLNASDDDIREYMLRFNLPHNPLRDQGYTSIGCWPCTTPTTPGEDPRAGRWRQTSKTECGLHQRPVILHSNEGNHQ